MGHDKRAIQQRMALKLAVTDSAENRTHKHPDYRKAKQPLYVFGPYFPHVLHQLL
ncbi:transcriptional regulator [Paenibacillus polymyxa]|uniref:hypothetical protein n=1 Tax=Paenibacillus polymyxa TaxID=1406 RepID=UPI0002EAA9F5|nr:hypothetical protein [Paenibacillus polymyxa]KKD55925.1 transcriptional regulator [Paenibacillus sp. ICGEB2008]RPD97404.1 transcriptional regulator [Paenibacillus polymyxa]UNL94247.1 transcriptional regulator [Paenibacillus polymyxa]